MADSQRKTANLLNPSVLADGYHLDVTTGLPTQRGNNDRVATLTPIDVSSISAVTLSYLCTINDTNFMYSIFDANDTLLERVTAKHSGDSIDVSNAAKLYIAFYGNSDVTISSLSQIMLNKGSTPLPYEPYGWVHSLRKLTTSTDTITTLPADIYANDTTATVGLKGNMEQTGTPTPQNPIQPLETGERTGNLFELTDSSATANIIDTLVDLGADVTFDTITCSCVFDNLEAEGITGAFIDYRMDDGTHQYVALSSMSNVNDNTGVPINVKVNGNYYNTKKNITFRRIQVYLSTTGYNKFKSGSIKWAFYDSGNKYYEPYGYKIPISSGGTTTPVYLGEVESTRRIKKLVLTGESVIYKNDPTSYLYYVTDVPHKSIDCICSHLPSTNSYPIGETGGIYSKDSSHPNIMYINLSKSVMEAQPSGNTVAGFKEYLAQQYAAGTPVTVWYVLATETTGIVNEPIRKIGTYADTVSGITIPTITGKDTFDVETTLKPSEVTVNYHGWHPVADVQKRESGAWH